MASARRGQEDVNFDPRVRRNSNGHDAVRDGHLPPAARLTQEMGGIGESGIQKTIPGGRQITPIMSGSNAGGERVLDHQPHAKGKHPLIVTVGYKINSIGEVNSVTACFEVDFKLFVHWEDPAFIGKDKDSVKKASSSKLDPGLEFMNGRKLNIYHQDAKLKNSATGAIKLSIYCRGWMMMMSMDLYMFPFDCQNLQIGVKPNKKDITEVVLASGERSINMILRQEWDVVGHLCRAYHTDPSTSSSTKVYSSMHIIVLVRRESGWYVKNIMLPTVAMVILNYTVYAFPLDEVGARMEIAVGLVLATAVNKIVVSDKLAKVPYQTFIDRFQGACFYYQLFLGIQMPAIYLAYVGIEHNVAFWLNIILFLSSAILFFTLCYSFTQSLTRHLTDVDVWKALAHDDKEESPPEAKQQRESHHTTREAVDLLLRSPTDRSRRMTHMNAHHSSASSVDIDGSDDDEVGSPEAQDSFVSQLQTLKRAESVSKINQRKNHQRANMDDVKRKASVIGTMVVGFRDWANGGNLSEESLHRMDGQFEIGGMRQSAGTSGAARSRQKLGPIPDEDMQGKGSVRPASETKDTVPPPALSFAVTGPKSFRDPLPATLLFHMWAMHAQSGSAELSEESPEVRVTVVVDGCSVDPKEAVLGWSGPNIGWTQHVVKVPESNAASELDGKAIFDSPDASEIVHFRVSNQQLEAGAEGSGEGADIEAGQQAEPKSTLLAEAHHFCGQLSPEARGFFDRVSTGRPPP